MVSRNDQQVAYYVTVLLQTKIVKLVSKQLVIKARVKAQEKLKIYPKTEQWLRIVGVRESHRKVGALTLNTFSKMSLKMKTIH